MDYTSLNNFYKIWKNIHFQRVCNEVIKSNTDLQNIREDIIKVLDQTISGITIMMLCEFRINFICEIETDIRKYIAKSNNY